MKQPLLRLSPFLAVAALVIYFGYSGAQAQRTASTVPPCTPPFDIACYLPGGARVDPDVVRINREISATEAQTVAQILRTTPSDLAHQLSLLGKAEIFDSNLSVYKNVACATCHMPEAAFKDAASRFNATTVAMAGAVPITNVGFNRGRTFGQRHPDAAVGNRNPQTYGYAALMQPLQYDTSLHQFVGGNFWDMRATGLRLGNPAAEQAQGPPLNPVEMGMADEGCIVYRISQSKYASLFKRVFGAQVLAVQFPRDVESVCGKPGGTPTGNVSTSTVYKPGNNPNILKFSAADRRKVAGAFDFFAEAIAAYEASPEVSPFSSKFDAALHSKATLTAPEQRGFKLFNGKAVCSTCHSDVSSSGTMLYGIRVGGPNVVVKIHNAVIVHSTGALFTNEQASNLGLPNNKMIPYLYENVPDQFGYVANSAGPGYIDTGVADFLTSNNNPNPKWAAFAPQFRGRFATPTLRNAAKVPRADFVRAYMHNGYLKSLKEVVHFYNTRDALPHCAQGASGEKVTCWPPPEIPENVDKTVGNLHLSSQEEDDLVAFLRTLSDGYIP